MFHVHNGFFFERMGDGSVKVCKTRDGLEPESDCGNVNFQEFVDADTWASVVASVSAKGEGDGRFFVAQKFHNE